METLKNLSGAQKFVIGLIVGLIVGGGGTLLALKKSSLLTGINDQGEYLNGEETKNGNASGTTKTNTTTTINSGPSSVSVSGTNAVAVDDQKAGDRVEVTMITLSKSGWVAIHEDINGTPGRILGARRYDPGIYLGEVDLLRPTIAGQTYHAILHLDDGDKQFDLTKDLPIKGEDGKIVEVSFKAQ